MSLRDLSEIPHPIAYYRDPAGEIVCAGSMRETARSLGSDAVSPRTVVTVGNFDGVHLGHAAILTRLQEMAARLSAASVAFTFDPHPATLVRPDTAPAPLTTALRRAELLLHLGIDKVVVQPLVPALVQLSSTAFFDQVLRQRLGAVGLVEGTDFRFGKGREGDVAALASLCERHGLAFDVVGAVQAGDAVVSSSRVRNLIATGDVAAAAAVLTAPYRLTGEVVHGAQRGRTLGFPTANLAKINTLLPAPGVYAAIATIATKPTDRTTTSRYPAAVHLGANVSFGETAVSVEAHLMGFHGDLYHQPLHVDFLQRLRETLRFDSREAVVSQLKADVQQAGDVASSWLGAGRERRPGSALGHPTPPS